MADSEELLDAAERVFEEWGYRRASMEDIAREARLSRAGLYKHFSSKDTLFRAVLERVFRKTLQRAESRAREVADAAVTERLCALFEARQGALVDRVRGRLHGQELAEAAMRIAGDLCADSSGCFLETVAAELSQAEAGGEIDLRPAGVSARALAELMSRAVDGLKASSDESGNADFRARLPQLIHLMVHGLAPRPAPAGASGKPAQGRITR